MIQKLQKQISDLIVKALLAGEYTTDITGQYITKVDVYGVKIILWTGTGLVHQHTDEEPIVRFTPDEATAIRSILTGSFTEQLDREITILQEKLNKALTRRQDLPTIDSKENTNA